jgi:amino acid transporter
MTVERGLTRTLGVSGVLFLTLSATTPVSSVFVIVPETLQIAGSGALIAMALAAIVSAATAFVYAELSSAWPLAGGEYVMVGRTLGPMAGFVMLAVNLINNLLFPAVIGLGLSEILAVVWPGLPVVPTAIAMVTLATLTAILHIRVNAWLTGIFLALELLAVLVVVALGLWEPARPLLPLLAQPVAAGAGGLVPAGPVEIGLATTVAIFALNGYGLAVYFGEDMHDAPRRIARVILLALALTVAVEAAPLAAVLVGSPDLAMLFASPDPFGSFARLRGGDWLAGAIGIAVALAIVNAAIAGILAYARFLYSSGRHRAWGERIDPWVARIHPRFGSPHVATLLVGGAGVIACFLPLSFLLVLSGAGIAVTYMGIALAAIVGRTTGTTAGAHYRMPLYPLAPIISLVALGGAFWASWLDTETGRPGLIATGVQMLVAAAWYALVVRRRGEWRIHDPAEEEGLLAPQV